MKATEGRIEIGPKRKRKFPWLLFLLLLGSIYFFWILPYYQLGSRPVKVEFSSDTMAPPPATNRPIESAPR